MRRTIPLLATLLTAGLAFAPAAVGQDASQLIYEAFYLESAVRDVDGAAAKYAAAADRSASDGDAVLEAKARLGHGRCLLALGRREEAVVEFQAVLRLDPGNAAAEEALSRQERDGGIDPELRLKIQALVQRLGTAERENAIRDLRRIGALAIPFLADGLRSRDVAVVEYAAQLLCGTGSPVGLDTLDRAFDDEEVLFPHVMAESLGSVVPDVAHPVWMRAIELPPGPGRDKALERFLQVGGGRLECAPMLRRLLADFDPEIRYKTIRYLKEPVVTALGSELVARYDVESPPGERQVILSALQGFDDPTATEIHRRALLDVDDRVRQAAALGIRSRVNSGIVAPSEAHVAAARMLAEDDAKLATYGVELLNEFPRPWSDDVRTGVLSAIETMIRARSLRRTFWWIFEHGPDLSPAQITALIERAGDPSFGLDENDRTKVREHLVRHALARLEDDAARGAWIATRFAEMSDAAGQQVLLGAGGSLAGDARAEVLLLGAASEHFSVRFDVYRTFTHRKAAPVPAFVYGRLPYATSDLTHDDDGMAKAAFELLRGGGRPEWFDAARSFYRRQPTRASALRLLLDCAEEKAADVAAEVLATAGQTEVRRMAIDTLIQDLGADGAARAAVEAASGKENSVEVLKTGPAGPRSLPSSFLSAYVDALPDAAVDAGVIWELYREASPEGLERLVRLGLASDDPDAVRAACIAARDAVFEPALPTLIPLLDSRDAEIRKRAEEAVEEIRGKKKRRLEAELLGPEGKTASLVRAKALLSDEDPVKRQGGALALGALGDAAAVPLLLDLLDDSSEEVRTAALKALEALGGASSGGE